MYEVLALKYGERDTTKCQFFYRESSHDKLTLDYFVWLILGGPHPLLVDTGFRDDDARARGIRNYVSPAAMVERAGVNPGDIPISLITHLHYDHWAGHSLFPNAEFWIQGEEVAFWTGPFGRQPAERSRPERDFFTLDPELRVGEKAVTGPVVVVQVGDQRDRDVAGIHARALDHRRRAHVVADAAGPRVIVAKAGVHQERVGAAEDQPHEVVERELVVRGLAVEELALRRVPLPVLQRQDFVHGGSPS